LLLFLSNILPPKTINIQDINNKSLNKKVQIQGQTINIKNYEESDFQILTLRDETGEIDVTLDNIANLTKNKNIQVIGTIIEYNGRMEIHADKIISSP